MPANERPTTSPLGTLSEGGRDFIDDAQLTALANLPEPDAATVRDILAKSLAKQPLNVEETAHLLAVRDRDVIDEIEEAARTLKRTVYGNRIVLFAPLYVGNLCRNDCTYCSFRRSNREAVRHTLSGPELDAEVRALTEEGHKRLILVFGEHKRYDAEFIAETARRVYACKDGSREIRRVNINAAPLDHDGFRIVKEAGIGTYQIFQETYDHSVYRKVHPPKTNKGDYLWRLDGPARAIEAGADDVGIGALFGLADWRFETLAMVAHANDLRARYDVGPHTVSFPRIQPAAGIEHDDRQFVSDEEFKRLVAVLRLAIPYTGLILTARENPQLRRDVMAFGVSQIDAGSRIEIGGYSENAAEQTPEREQFLLGDTRPLDEVMRELVEDGYVPSFCTACYRKGRTGEHFMEFAVPGFIKRLCTPNALLTLQEYLVDHGSAETKAAGDQLIEEELKALRSDRNTSSLENKLEGVRERGERDLYY